jgi:hypothetical protein
MLVKSTHNAGLLLFRTLVSIVLLVTPAVASSQAEPPAVVSRKGQQISISGHVAPATMQAVQRELASSDAAVINTLIIQSAGGEMDSMIQLGSIVRERKWTVQVERVCATICAAYLAPAAARLVVPADSFLLFTPIFSPDTKPNTSSPDEANALRTAVERQNGYFKLLGIDADRIYAVARAVETLQSKLAAVGKPAPFLSVDGDYLRHCLGAASVDVPKYTIADSKRLAHRASVPFAFLIDGKLFYEGEEVAPFQPACYKTNSPT